MKYYYDFDMQKTFTTEEMKEAYEEHKKAYEYGDFEGFLEVEGAYMDEISEEIFNILRKQEQEREKVLQRIKTLEIELKEIKKIIEG